MVGIEEVLALVSPISMHTVRIYHEVELLAMAMKLIKQL